jgi:hypothetical protein
MSWYREANEKYEHIPEKNKGGDCFTNAFDYIFQEGILKGNNNLVIVHAIIKPMMGELAGVEFGHAWVEDGDTVIDTSRDNQQMDKQSYYLFAGLLIMPTMENQQFEIKKDKIKTYNIEDAKRLAVDHGHYGPWDSQFDDYVLENEGDDGSDSHK